MTPFTAKLALGALCTIAASLLAWVMPGLPDSGPSRPVAVEYVYEATPLLPTTTTTTPFNEGNCLQVVSLALVLGWPASEADTIAQVAARESRCTSDAFNALDTAGGSYGLYQINGFWCNPSTYWPQGWLQAQGILTNCQQLFDPVINTKAAYQIWLNSGWAPWKTAQ
jgi:hypothetical protein